MSCRCLCALDCVFPIPPRGCPGQCLRMFFVSPPSRRAPHSNFVEVSVCPPSQRVTRNNFVVARDNFVDICVSPPSRRVARNTSNLHPESCPGQFLRTSVSPPSRSPYSTYVTWYRDSNKTHTCSNTFQICGGWLVYDGPGPGGAENGRNIVLEPVLFFGKGSNILLTATS